ncbi:nucleotidyltransferase family protein [Psychrobacter sp. 1Y11]|uniref:nucleotidyltransferase family protein n=1 Tax=Psychrobacter sp. 1Y11 TaxID=3457446 RepID=UPI003FD144F6
MSDRSLVTQNAPQNHAVIILASGLSHRLGQPKQLLKKQGKPLVDYMTALALATQPQTIIVVIPKQNLAIRSTLDTIIDEPNPQNPNIEIVHNAAPETGMAQSLSLAIDALKAQHDLVIKRVLIIGVDQVLLEAEHLKQLLTQDNLVVASRYPYLDDNFIVNENKSDIVGLPIVVNYELLNTWQSSLSGDKGLRHFIRVLPAESIANISNDRLSFDIDTPKQLAYAKEKDWLD